MTERIVVIDDNANDLQVIRRVLERNRYAVQTATSGEDGIALGARIPPDAFIVDYRMPGMDGLEVARRIKSDPHLQTIPVLMLTGADAARTIAEGLNAGADDFVTKGSENDATDATPAARSTWCRPSIEPSASPSGDTWHASATSRAPAIADAASSSARM